MDETAEGTDPPPLELDLFHPGTCLGGGLVLSSPKAFAKISPHVIPTITSPPNFSSKNRCTSAKAAFSLRMKQMQVIPVSLLRALTITTSASCSCAFRDEQIGGAVTRYLSIHACKRSRPERPLALEKQKDRDRRISIRRYGMLASRRLPQ